MAESKKGILVYTYIDKAGIEQDLSLVIQDVDNRLLDSREPLNSLLHRSGACRASHAGDAEQSLGFRSLHIPLLIRRYRYPFWVLGHRRVVRPRRQVAVAALVSNTCQMQELRHECTKLNFFLFFFFLFTCFDVWNFNNRQ